MPIEPSPASAHIRFPRSRSSSPKAPGCGCSSCRRWAKAARWSSNSAPNSVATRRCGWEKSVSAATLARLDLAVNLDGHGSATEVVGLFFGHRDQTLDYRMVLNHRGEKSSSNVLLKGAVEDSARSVFSGLVRIEKNANGASAFETNRNLVLSADAKANSIPNLEILCDDVVCGHGSSVGPLEEDHLYYLGSRGISPAVPSDCWYAVSSPKCSTSCRSAAWSRLWLTSSSDGSCAPARSTS